MRTNSNKTIKIIIGFVLIVSITLFIILFKGDSKEINGNQLGINGSPLPPNYFYNACKGEEATWNCSTKINNANCCICKNINEKFYFSFGCSLLTPKELCLNSNGNWSVSEDFSENFEKCICPKDFSYLKGECIKK